MTAMLAKKEQDAISSAAVARKKKPLRGKEHHLSVVVSTDLVQAADEEAERLSQELRLRLTRTDIVRRWLEDGAALANKQRGKK